MGAEEDAAKAQRGQGMFAFNSFVSSSTCVTNVPPYLTNLLCTPTTDAGSTSAHPLPIAPNRLNEVLAPLQPNEIWVSDITYIATAEGWVYLAAIMDLCSRSIVGWATADHLKSSLVEQALRHALYRRRPPAGLLHHSDRGRQYASPEYWQLIQQNLLPSMSAAGNCYDNASMESFFSTLKTELIHRRHWLTHAEVKLALFDYLETFITAADYTALELPVASAI